MKMVMVFAFDVPEDSDVIQDIMRTTATRLITMGGISKDYSPEAFVAIRESADAVLQAVREPSHEPVE